MAEESNYAKISTTLGDMYIELYAEEAPETVKNFKSYITSDYYDGTIFHRVINGFMIQGGGFVEGHSPKPGVGEPISNEADNGLKNTYGTLAMARTGDPHSATSQFFINVSDNAFLDFRSADQRGYGYAVFGKVIGSYDTVNKIATTPVEFDPRADQSQPAKPVTTVVIEDITLVPADSDELKAVLDAEVKRVEAEKEAAKNKLKPGIDFVQSLGHDTGAGKTTESGLWYLHLEEGGGASPSATQTVTVHYTGYLVNGTVFDSSRERGQTISFPLNGVIPGWTEGLQLMKTGGRTILVIPSELGYGPRGAGGVIPPNATLIFDIELILVQ